MLLKNSKLHELGSGYLDVTAQCYDVWMESYLNVGGTNSGLRITHGDVSLIAGIGRHRLRISDTVSAANERADQLVVTFAGDLVIPSLGIASGYVGTILPTTPQRITRDGSFPIIFDVELMDDQIRRIEDRRSVSADGGFDLVLNLRVESIDTQNAISHGSGQLQSHKITREAWLEGLRQMGFRQVQVIELEVVDSSANPTISKAIEYFKLAQNRYSNGEYREVAESLRQSLTAIVGMSEDDETDSDQYAKDLGELQKEARNSKIGYPARIEYVRKALKFAADVGAHPEAGDTNRFDALAQLHMTAGLIQWYAKH